MTAVKTSNCIKKPYTCNIQSEKAYLSGIVYVITIHNFF